MLEDKQIRYLQYLAMQAGRSITVTDDDIMLDGWKYSLPADEAGYKNTEYNLKFAIDLERRAHGDNSSLG